MARITRRDFLSETCRHTLAVAIGSAAMSRAAALAAQVEAATQRTKSSRRVFSFLHTYESTGRYWRGIERAGLVRKTTGIRLINSPWGGDEHRFNHVARLGGPLHQILRRRRCPFVIDRVAGGSPYRPYPFDVGLVRAYARLLGDRFLGGQVHEPVSNTHNDWQRFVEANAKFEREAIRPDELRAYFTGANERRWLEYGTLEDYAGRVHPVDGGAFWPETEWNVQRNARRFGSRFSCAEGSHWGQLAWHLYYKWGAKACFAEVGPWASKESQFAIASLRGAAKAAGRPWGVYFAPWGPKGCTSLLPQEDWTWRCPREEMDASSWPVGPALGPSTALQRRIFFHAYLSGAHTLHEEWGAEGNLESWADAKLSSYGQVTHDLLDFQEAHPDVGEPYTPLALVLDPQMPTPAADPWARLQAALFQPGPTDLANAARPNSGRAEVACYAPCVVPEVFDIVPSDAPQRAWKSYQTAIEVGAGDFSSDRVVTLARELSPFELTPHLPMQINRRKRDGDWILGLYNPWGATRGDVGNVGSVLDDACTTRATLRPRIAVRSLKVLYGWPNGTMARRRDDEIEVVIGPGGTLVLAITPAFDRH